MTDINANLRQVQDRIRNAAGAAGRAHDAVKLIAVSKGKSETDVKTALAAGQKIFGENRVQEATRKFSALRETDHAIELHLIGPLQTNKADDAVRLFDVIQTLDRPKLAAALAVAIKKAGRNPRCLIEINSGDETQKAGIKESELPAFLDCCRKTYALTVTGLMCIPPQNEDPKKYFLRVRNLAVSHKLPDISMGMSADYETAITCGATIVRVGTAIFGAR